MSAERTVDTPDQGAERVACEYERWERTTLSTHLDEHPELRSSFRTGSGETEVQAIYTPGDVDATPTGYLKRQGFPGEYPFTRGRLPSGYRSFPWRLGFYAGFGGPKEANERFKRLVAAGAGYVTLAMDLSSQCGYDLDDPIAASDVGKVGVSITSLDDMLALYDGVPLSAVGTGTVGNCIAPIMVGMFSLTAEHQGVDPRDARISIQNDPLKEFTGRGTQIVPIEPSVALAADVVEYCLQERPGWICQYACTTQLRWGGVNASEEIAFGLANLFSYIDAVVERGFDPANVVPQLEGLHMTTDNDFFEEVAKFRAARRLWARLAHERYGTEDSRVLGLKITTFTGAHRLTAQQPLNNVNRTAVHVLASLLGGVERISTPAYDEALALPTEESTRVANLTKMIILYEQGIANSVDPLGGSYLVEYLTDELERSAEEIFRSVEQQGGAVAAISGGLYEEAMLRGLRRMQDEIESGDRTLVGVNEFVIDDEPPIVLHEVDDEYRSERLGRLADLRTKRDQASVDRVLAKLEDVLEEKRTGSRTNAVDAFTECVQARATIGEIGRVMRDVFGE